MNLARICKESYRKKSSLLWQQLCLVEVTVKLYKKKESARKQKVFKESNLLTSEIMHLGKQNCKKNLIMKVQHVELGCNANSTLD